MKPILLIIISTILIAIGQLTFSAAQKTGADSLFSVFPIHWLSLIGLISYAIGAVFFILAIKGGEVSRIFPMNSLSYVWVAIGGIVILGEAAGEIKLLATLAIIIGVVLVAKG